MSRLSVRLAAVTLVIGLVGGLLGGWMVRQSTRSAIQTEAEHLTLGLAERLASQIDSSLNSMTTSFRVLATRQEIFDFTDRADLELAVVLRAFDEVEELDLHDGTGRLVAAVAQDRLVDPAEVAPPVTVVIGERRVVLRSGNQASVEITVPVENPPGTVVGSLRGRMRLEVIVQVLEARLLGSSAKAIFVGPGGVILDHPERNRVLDHQQYPLGAIPAGGATALDRDGVRVLAGSAPTAGLPGSVVIEWQESDALSVANRSATLVGVSVALIVLATVAVLLVFTGRLLRPLESLRLVLRQIGDGDRDARVEEVGSTEFRQVAVDVNAMAAAVTQSIADLERTQAELAAATSQFRAAFQQAPVPMAIATPAGVLIDVNPAFCTLLGRSREEMLAATISELTHPEDRAATVAAIADSAASGRTGFEMEKAYLRVDGEAVPTRTSVAGVLTTDGTLDYLIAHMVDLSDLREAEDRFKRIVDSSPDVFLVVDPDGRIMLASGRLADMFGYQSEQLIGQAVELLVPAASRAGHSTRRRGYPNDVVREMGSGLDLSARRADGSEFPVEIALSPIVIAHAPHVLATVRDVTARRQGEAAASELLEMRTRQRQAIEINDNIVQGLTIARWSFDLGEIEAAQRAVERTVETARLLVDRMLAVSGEMGPGALRREAPVGSSTDD